MFRKVNWIALISFILAANLFAVDDYKKYRPFQIEDCFLRVAVSEKELVFDISIDDVTETLIFNKEDVKKTPEGIFINDYFSLNENGFIIAGKTYPVSIIDRINIETPSQAESQIYFLKKSTAGPARAFQSRRQNKISLLENVSIDSSQFIRGSVASFWADISIEGEVNEDVVAVFGNIKIGNNAVIRGNIVAINGNITVAKKATIYGSIRSSSAKDGIKFDKWAKWYRKERLFSPIFKFYYNRVDGAAPYLGIHFQDEDKFFNALNSEFGIRDEKYKWLDGHRCLWSLFGGGKRFAENFSTVAGHYRPIGKAEIDSKEISSWIAKIEWRSQKSDSLFGVSSWNTLAELEWAPGGWNNDCRFNRYLLSLTRHQSTGRQTGLLLKAIYGGSGGYLPLQRRYFLGGLGTLHGYRQKEYMGTEFWLGDIGYGMEFPDADMAVWVFYNVGQIGNDAGQLAHSEIKHSLGIGLSFGNEFRINLAKRMDRSGASPRIYVRFEHLF
ncbi:MAG: polymer-forming cytoskeletal protein [candidate division Zixibacteria bacterium]|nr:polymer-forming cytoskeletal protein [candidate division Zixibacteria bacterium]